jgi:Domain of unknown function (DUF1906)
VRGRLVAAAAVAALLLIVGSGSAASRVGTFTGYAFDACTAPSTSALTAWEASPYRGLGIYLGGVNRACKDGNLSAPWVTSVLASGWSLLPLYVGLQAPCVGQSGLQLMSATPATAANQGRAAADDAVSRASVFGLPGGSPIYFDMEGYSTTNASCTKAVQSFLTAWTAELRALGYVAGVYGSAASTIRDVAALGSAMPDAAWIANWNGVESVFGDPYVSDTLWANHQRVHQYKGGHKETWGGVTINIDSNVVDGPVVGGNAAPPPPPPEPPAGSVGSGDSRATATWPSGAFPTTAVVTLTPTSQPPAPNGYAVQLTVTDSATSLPVTRFAKAVIVHLLMTTGGLTPSYSSDGTTWKPMPLLTSAALPSGVDTGYTIDPDGTIEIQTLVPGFFGLLPDTVPPSQPQGFAGHFVKGALVLSWQGATDNSGMIASYQLLLDGTPVSSLAAKKRRVVVRSFHVAGPTVYRVRAVDPSGIYGKPSAPVVVLPTRRPTDTPRPVPRWAWALFTWQHSGGARPAAAPKKPPAWYWHWAAWRLAPFHVRR